MSRRNCQWHDPGQPVGNLAFLLRVAVQIKNNTSVHSGTAHDPGDYIDCCEPVEVRLENNEEYKRLLARIEEVKTSEAQGDPA